jgi:hypothetical protein
MDDMEKREFLILTGLELRLLGRPARSQSPYGLLPEVTVCGQIEVLSGNFPGAYEETHSRRYSKQAPIEHEWPLWEHVR